MKTLALPLAAAFLAAAVSSQAQSQFGAPFGGAPINLSGVSFTVAAPDGRSPLNVAATFQCADNFVETNVCTPEQKRYRKQVLDSGMCPMPVIDACAAFIVRSPGAGAFSPAQGLDPLTMTDDFYKKCGTVPFRNCTPDEQRAQDAWRRGQSVVQGSARGAAAGASAGTGVDGVVMGPPCPPEICNKSVDADAAWASQFEQIRAQNPTAISVGREKYILPDPEDPSKVTECTVMMCGREPVDASKYSQYADQIQAAVAGANMFTGSSAGGSRTPPPAASTPPGGGPSANPRAPSTGDQGGAREDAGDIAAAQSAIGRGASGQGVSGTGTGGGWSGDAAGASGGSAGRTEPIKVNLDEIETTYIPHQQMERRLEATRRQIEGGEVEDLAASDGTTQRSKRLRGDPPVDERFLGKQQFSANDGSAR